MIVAGMAKCSLVDYPGLPAAVLFVPGCNYNCFFCHNRALIDGTHEVLELGVVRHFLEKRAGLLDAIVVSGGEPTLQKDLLPRLEELHYLGYRIKVDSNGSSPDVIAQILEQGLCDYFAIDYKAPAARYQEFCGKNADAQRVHETINLLMDASVDFEVRTTVIPSLDENDLIRIAEELPPLPRYALNPYRIPDNYLPVDEKRIRAKPHSPAEIESLRASLRSAQPHIC
jgi:pyruvate formate lyase activating enzyme